MWSLADFNFSGNRVYQGLTELWRRLNSIKLLTVETKGEVLLHVVDLVPQALKLVGLDACNRQSTLHPGTQVGNAQITHSRKRQLQLVTFLVSEYDFHRLKKFTGLHRKLSNC